jgi:dTDP-4-dehydrorhamnose reductase
MSKYDFGVAIARRFGWDESLVLPESVDRSALTARRAHNLFLSAHRLSTDLGRPLPTFSTGLDRFYTQYQQGYPQKIRSYPQA